YGPPQGRTVSGSPRLLVGRRRMAEASKNYDGAGNGGAADGREQSLTIRRRSAVEDVREREAVEACSRRLLEVVGRVRTSKRQIDASLGVGLPVLSEEKADIRVMAIGMERE